MSAFALALLLATPPDPASLAWGGEYAVRGERAQVEGMLERDRVWVSRWWDGRWWQSAEQVTWLSPRFLSRWTGYEGARNAWTPAQTEAAWRDLEGRYLRGSTFVVSLCAFPKMTTYEVGERTKPDPTPLGDVRVVLVRGDKREELTLRPLATPAKHAELAITSIWAGARQPQAEQVQFRAVLDAQALLNLRDILVSFSRSQGALQQVQSV